jgi:hypothetical protein
VRSTCSNKPSRCTIACGESVGPSALLRLVMSFVRRHRSGRDTTVARPFPATMSGLGEWLALLFSGSRAH